MFESVWQQAGHVPDERSVDWASLTLSILIQYNPWLSRIIRWVCSIRAEEEMSVTCPHGLDCTTSFCEGSPSHLPSLGCSCTYCMGVCCSCRLRLAAGQWRQSSSSFWSSSSDETAAAGTSVPIISSSSFCSCTYTPALEVPAGIYSIYIMLVASCTCEEVTLYCSNSVVPEGNLLALRCCPLLIRFNIGEERYRARHPLVSCQTLVGLQVLASSHVINTWSERTESESNALEVIHSDWWFTYRGKMTRQDRKKLIWLHYLFCHIMFS